MINTIETSDKLTFKFIEIASILFLGLGWTDLLEFLPIAAGGFVAGTLGILQLAKAFKIISETIRENKQKKKP